MAALSAMVGYKQTALERLAHQLQSKAKEQDLMMIELSKKDKLIQTQYQASKKKYLQLYSKCNKHCMKVMNILISSPSSESFCACRLFLC